MSIVAFSMNKRTRSLSFGRPVWTHGAARYSNAGMNVSVAPRVTRRALSRDSFNTSLYIGKNCTGILFRIIAPFLKVFIQRSENGHSAAFGQKNEYVKIIREDWLDIESRRHCTAYGVFLNQSVGRKLIDTLNCLFHIRKIPLEHLT